MNNKNARQEVVGQLHAKIFGQASLLIGYSAISTKLAEQYFEKYLIKYTALPTDNKIVVPTIDPNVNFQPVDIKDLAVSNK